MNSSKGFTTAIRDYSSPRQLKIASRPQVIREGSCKDVDRIYSATPGVVGVVVVSLSVASQSQLCVPLRVTCGKYVLLYFTYKSPLRALPNWQKAAYN